MSIEMETYSYIKKYFGDHMMWFLRDCSNVHDELDLILKRWREPHRFYHGEKHLINLLDHFAVGFDNRERFLLNLIALYHDIVYDPLKSDNEEKQ